MTWIKRLYHKEHDHECGEGCNHEHHQQEQQEPAPKKRIIPRRRDMEITFSNFLTFFPEVDLPINITSETQKEISEIHDPLANKWIEAFVFDKDEYSDEYTEFMPCFRIPNTNGFIAIVYWEASLIGSAYVLVSFSKTGIVIDKREIAGTKYTRDELIQTVCTIDENWRISGVEGSVNAHDNSINPAKSRIISLLQLSQDGEVLGI